MENMINGRLSMMAMERARLSAEKASTPAGRSRGGWVRLARVESRTGREVEPYVIAIRAIASDRSPVQFGCSCPDWVYRKQKTGESCKHQREFLSHVGGSSPRIGLWLYKAGAAFTASIQGREVSADEG
jgi:hypothetical protein